MIDNYIAIGINSIELAILIYVIVRALDPISKGDHSMRVIFYLFAMISMLCSAVYWIAFDILRPDLRMPIAANEIGESAAFLLLASAMSSDKSSAFTDARKEVSLAVLFVMASVALWIGWSGEWIQDILGGFTFGYYGCVAVWDMKRREALLPWQWKLMGIIAFLLVLMEAGVFFVPDSFKKGLDLACYGLMFASLGILALIISGAFKRKTSPHALFAIICGSHFWTSSLMYMSEGPYYLASYLGTIMMFPLMLLSIRKEQEAL